MEFNTDGCGRAIVAGQPSQQLRLVGARGRVHQPNSETIRHTRERQSACVDHPIYGTNSESNANSYSHGHGDGHFDTYSNAYLDANTDANAHSHSYGHTDTHTDWEAQSYAEASTHSAAKAVMMGKADR